MALSARAMSRSSASRRLLAGCPGRSAVRRPWASVPDEPVGLISADRAAVADAAADVAVVVRADAPVVVDPLVGGAGCGSVAAVATLAADEDPLQQGGLLGVALGEVCVLGQAGLGE